LYFLSPGAKTNAYEDLGIRVGRSDMEFGQNFRKFPIQKKPSVGFSEKTVVATSETVGK
jgi:hypothetical protein